jgi:hypothetical protein
MKRVKIFQEIGYYVLAYVIPFGHLAILTVPMYMVIGNDYINAVHFDHRSYNFLWFDVWQKHVVGTLDYQIITFSILLVALSSFLISFPIYFLMKKHREGYNKFREGLPPFIRG